VIPRLLVILLLAAAPLAVVSAQPPPAPGAPNGVGTSEPGDEPFGPMNVDPEELKKELQAAVVRLPVAALLGTALALRPRRRGTPPRQPAVVQTQIVLAAVGALIMLVVGASLARAFGIVGAANLIRYRSKIDDPKDAVVMLCALAVGLAAGVGLYGLATFGTFFLVLALWIIEGFEPQTRVWELSVKLEDNTAELRPQVEAVLRRFKADFELRGQSEEEVSYVVTAPLELHTDRVSNALTALVPTGKGGVEWKERPKIKSK
jgi:uncharacterized membrane protein YhiD involved in acid resistance